MKNTVKTKHTVMMSVLILAVFFCFVLNPTIAYASEIQSEYDSENGMIVVSLDNSDEVVYSDFSSGFWWTVGASAAVAILGFIAFKGGKK